MPGVEGIDTITYPQLTGPRPGRGWAEVSCGPVRGGQGGGGRGGGGRGAGGGGPGCAGPQGPTGPPPRAPPCPVRRPPELVGTTVAGAVRAPAAGPGGLPTGPAARPAVEALEGRL